MIEKMGYDMTNVQAVPTISDLRGYSIASPVPDLFVRGYHDINDGGGGWFRYSTTAAVAENGGTVFRPNGVPGTDPGRWIRVMPQPNRYHVRWFGARGDGSTDDTQALQAAIDALRPMDVLDFAMHDDAYLVSPPTAGAPCLVLGTSEVTLVGVHGFRSPKIRCETMHATILHISGRAISIDGLAFVGDGIQITKGFEATVNGIHWRYDTPGREADVDSQVINCRFSLMVRALDVAGRNVEVRNNAFVACRRALHIIAVDPRSPNDGNIQTLRGWWIHNNRFHAGASSPQETETADISCIWVERDFEPAAGETGPVTTNYEFGNSIQDNFADYDVRFYVGPLKWGEILNNHIHYARTGKRADGGYPGIINLLASDSAVPATRGWRVAGNVISAQAGSVYDGCGIWCEASNGTIADNVISGMPGEAVVLSAASGNVTVTGNLIDDASREWDQSTSSVIAGRRDAIVLEGSGHTIFANRINATQGYAIRHGIHVAGGTANIGLNHVQTSHLTGQALYVAAGATLAGEAGNTAEQATGNVRARRRIVGDVTTAAMLRTVDRGTIFDRTSAGQGDFDGQICIASGTNGAISPLQVSPAGTVLTVTAGAPDDLRIGDIIDIGSDKAGCRVLTIDPVATPVRTITIETATSETASAAVTLHPPLWASREQINLRGVTSWSPSAIAAAGTVQTTIAVPGASAPDAYVVVAPPSLPAGGLVVQGFVSADDTVTVTLVNVGGTSLTPPGGTWRVRVFNDAVA